MPRPTYAPILLKTPGNSGSRIPISGIFNRLIFFDSGKNASGFSQIKIIAYGIQFGDRRIPTGWGGVPGCLNISTFQQVPAYFLLTLYNFPSVAHSLAIIEGGRIGH